ncbi:MAG: hypothetical protein AAF968_09925 [Pseudomonadota bacterium]
MSTVLQLGRDLARRGGVRPRPIGDNALGRRAGGVKKPPEQPLRRLAIRALLQNFLVKHPMPVRSARQLEALFADRELKVIAMPNPTGTVLAARGAWR